jgi:hypothetical protein
MALTVKTAMNYTHKDHDLISKGYAGNATAYKLASKVLGKEAKTISDIYAAQKIIFEGMSSEERKKDLKKTNDQLRQIKSHKGGRTAIIPSMRVTPSEKQIVDQARKNLSYSDYLVQKAVKDIGHKKSSKN